MKDTWVLDSIVDFFGLDPEFPIRQQLVTRSGVKDEKGARKIYFVSSGRPSALCLSGSVWLQIQNEQSADEVLSYHEGSRSLRSFVARVEIEVPRPEKVWKSLTYSSCSYTSRKKAGQHCA